MKEFESRVQVSFYQAPEQEGLANWVKWLFPEQAFSMDLHHFKIYLFDDNLIIGR